MNPPEREWCLSFMDMRIGWHDQLVRLADLEAGSDSVARASWLQGGNREGASEDSNLFCVFGNDSKG